MISILLVCVLVLAGFWAWVYLAGGFRGPRSFGLALNLQQFKDKGPGVALLSPYYLLDKATGVVIQKDGILQKTFAFRGPDLDNFSDQDIDLAAAQINRILMRRGSGWSFHFEAQKFNVREYEESPMPGYALRVIEAERKARFQEEHRYFQSSYYFTLTYKPHAETSGKIKGFFMNPDATAPLYKELEDFREAFNSVMGEFGHNLLTCRELTPNETLSYLKTAFSWNWHPMELPEGYCPLDAILFDTDVVLEGTDVLVLGDHLSKVITIKAFPARTVAGILDAINRLGLEYRWVTRWIPLDADQARSLIDKYQKMYFGSIKSFGDTIKKDGGTGRINKGAIALMEQADAAAVQLDVGNEAFGKLSVAIQLAREVRDGDIETALVELKNKVTMVVKHINAVGFSAKVEDMLLLEAWRTMQPGNVYNGIRRHPVSSRVTTDILPFTAVWTGSEESAYMREIGGNGGPTMVCGTRSTSPFFYPINVADVLHFVVFGPTGAGKTTFLILLMASVAKYKKPDTGEEARIHFFDVDRSTRQFAMAIGGKRYEPGVKGSMSFQPFRKLESPQDISWAVRFVEGILEIQKIQLTPKMRTEVTKAVKQLQTLTPSMRTFDKLAGTIHYSEHGHRPFTEYLMPYIAGGLYADLFSGESEGTEYAQVNVYEMRKLLEMGDLAVLPALMCMFREIEDSLDGRPTWVICDEVHKYMRIKAFADMILDYQKTGRKKRMGVGVCLQDVAEMRRHMEFTSSIQTNCPTKIFLPNPQAPEQADVYQAFGVTEAEIELIATSIKKHDYIYKSELGCRQFQLELGPKFMNLCLSLSNAEGHAILDKMEGWEPERIARWMIENGKYK